MGTCPSVTSEGLISSSEMHSDESGDRRGRGDDSVVIVCVVVAVVFGVVAVAFGVFLKSWVMGDNASTIFFGVRVDAVLPATLFDLRSASRIQSSRAWGGRLLINGS